MYLIPANSMPAHSINAAVAGGLSEESSQASTIPQSPATAAAWAPLASIVSAHAVVLITVLITPRRHDP